VNARSSIRFDVDAAIVDLDGTLVDTLDDFMAALHGMSGALKLGQVDRAFVERSVGKGSEHLVREALRRLCAAPGLSQAEAEARAAALFDTALQAYQRAYGAVNGRYARIYEGVREGLAALAAQGLALVCVTNKPTHFAKALLAQLGVQASFAHVFGGDAFARKKPDPQPLLEACKALGTEPARTLMVGDSSNDAAAARAAGCPVALLSYGYNHGRPVREIDADAFADSLSEVASFIVDKSR
jgi:phosphoglycolate phosphatase